MSYRCWKHQAGRFQQYSTYEGQALPSTLAVAGDGLLAAQAPNTVFSTNAVDLESALRGLGSSGLEREVHRPQASMKEVPSLNLYKRNPTYLCNPLVVEADPRYTVFGSNGCGKQTK